MNPTSDLRGEHSAMQIILLAMKRLVLDIRVSINDPDMFRIGQIVDFLSIYTVHCHYEKEEKGPFTALLELDIPQVSKTIHHLMAEHTIARGYVEALNENIKKYLSGQYVSFASIALNLLDFVELEEQHIKTEDTIIFPYCDKLLVSSKLRSIASDFKIIQDEQVGHAKHFEYYLLLNQLNSENKLVIL